MSIGLVIANIAGSIRQLPAAANDGAANGVADGLADDVAAAPAEVAASGTSSALGEPLSGPAQLTAGFTLVVLELLNDQGAVVSTIPSAQQLAAYRNGTATPPS